MEKIRIRYKKKVIELEVRKVRALGQIRGLMLKDRGSENLLFEFKKDEKRGIHSFFVFFPFLAVWLDSHNTVIETKIVRPFTRYVEPKRKFRKLIEIPINEFNEGIIRFFEIKTNRIYI